MGVKELVVKKIEKEGMAAGKEEAQGGEMQNKGNYRARTQERLEGIYALRKRELAI